MIDTAVAANINAWLKSGSTGASAKSLCAALVGEGPQNGHYPHDAGDFRRCIRLLEQVPALRAKLPEAAKINRYWAALIPRWDEIEATTDPQTQTELIRSIVRPIEEGDPRIVRLGAGVSMRMGPLT